MRIYTNNFRSRLSNFRRNLRHEREYPRFMVRQELKWQFEHCIDGPQPNEIGLELLTTWHCTVTPVLIAFRMSFCDMPGEDDWVNI